jgi:hypothetical protein
MFASCYLPVFASIQAASKKCPFRPREPGETQGMQCFSDRETREIRDASSCLAWLWRAWPAAVSLARGGEPCAVGLGGSSGWGTPRISP